MENPDSISQAHLATGRAVDQLRRQLGIIFQEDNGALLGACPIEGLTPGLLAQLPPNRSLLLTTARARSLGFDTQNAKIVRINATHLSLSELQSLADPLADKTLPDIDLLPVTPSHETLLTLAKYASLLPAMLTVESAPFPADWLRVSASDVAAYWAAPPLDIVPLTQAALPMQGVENAKIICFRTRWGTSTHLALIIGEPGDNPLTRIHSSCITGDILGSLRCDCGDQLSMAIQQISEAGSGILLYLHQEGRGIGIANKLRAYQLQERGVDTYEANLMLGFEEDERDFTIAAAILKKLGIAAIRMLTNNPQKMHALEKAGITISQRIPLIAASGQHNHAYLKAKTQKAGHLF